MYSDYSPRFRRFTAGIVSAVLLCAPLVMSPCAADDNKAGDAKENAQRAKPRDARVDSAVDELHRDPLSAPGSRARVDKIFKQPWQVTTWCPILCQRFLDSIRYPGQPRTSSEDDEGVYFSILEELAKEPMGGKKPQPSTYELAQSAVACENECASLRRWLTYKTPCSLCESEAETVRNNARDLFYANDEYAKFLKGLESLEKQVEQMKDDLRKVDSAELELAKVPEPDREQRRKASALEEKKKTIERDMAATKRVIAIKIAKIPGFNEQGDKLYKKLKTSIAALKECEKQCKPKDKRVGLAVPGAEPSTQYAWYTRQWLTGIRFDWLSKQDIKLDDEIFSVGLDEFNLFNESFVLRDRRLSGSITNVPKSDGFDFVSPRVFRIGTRFRFNGDGTTVSGPGTQTSKQAPPRTGPPAAAPGDVDMANLFAQFFVDDFKQVGGRTTPSTGRQAVRPAGSLSLAGLREVAPGDWAFQTLRLLVERYGCQYPGTGMPERSMSRYEFAAFLNSCLDRVGMAPSLAEPTDVQTLARLQEEFAAELATLREPVDTLEQRLPATGTDPFSTTTRLPGEFVFEQTPGLDFDTRFTGGDGGFEWEAISPRVGLTYSLGAERKTLLRSSYARFAKSPASTFWIHMPFDPNQDMFYFDPAEDGTIDVQPYDSIIFGGNAPVREYEPLLVTGRYRLSNNYTISGRYTLEVKGEGLLEPDAQQALDTFFNPDGLDSIRVDRFTNTINGDAVATTITARSSNPNFVPDVLSRYAEFPSLPGFTFALGRETKAGPAKPARPAPDPKPRPKAFPNDGFFHAKGSWGQDFDDQWGLKRIGFAAAGRNGKRSLWPRKATATVVAVVDTGVDFGHPELYGALWANAADDPNNRKDDDRNGHTDDFLGWNFVDNNNITADNNGHGTFVAGIIAAATDNQLGIAGVNPWARIMPVKVAGHAGKSNSVDVAQGIAYAARMGARVINVSIGGRTLTRIEQAAVDEAVKRGALVVVAAGNEGVDVSEISPAGLRGVITVAATNPRDHRENYSNWGGGVDIAAPGTDILSLRAIQTDLMQFVDPKYQPGAHMVGTHNQYYRLSGRSFAAPYVSAVASLLLSINPALTAEEVKRMILHAARDIGSPGVDNLTGYGLLDADAALKADPEFFVEAAIDGVGVVQVNGRPYVRVTGTANADRMDKAWLEIGAGDDPKNWTKAGGEITKPVAAGVLGDIPPQAFGGAKRWTLRVITVHKNGRTRENRFVLNLG